jgi:hypothetical protein
VVIKRSSAREVAGLLEDLRRDDEAAREAAVARLAVIGTRAVEGLLAIVAWPEGSAASRLAALGALEAIADPRAIAPAAAALESDDPPIAEAAAAVLRACLNSTRGTEALDRLARVALDPGGRPHSRLAAIAALKALPAKDCTPIWEKLRADGHQAIRDAVASGALATGPSLTGEASSADPAAALEAAAGGGLPDDPALLRRWLAGDVSRVSLPILHRLVEVVRTREAQAADAAGRGAWMTARAAVHLALAQRDSRVALYDLRESIAKAPDAPVEMLTALEAIGDRSCLEPLAGAYTRVAAARGGDLAWWREHLASAFRAIAAREKITERHTVMRQIRTRWPEAADLAGPVRR